MNYGDYQSYSSRQEGGRQGCQEWHPSIAGLRRRPNAKTSVNAPLGEQSTAFKLEPRGGAFCEPVQRINYPNGPLLWALPRLHSPLRDPQHSLHGTVGTEGGARTLFLDSIEPINPCDAIFLPDRFPVEMTIHGILCMEQPISKTELIDLLQCRMAKIDRFRKIPVEVIDLGGRKKSCWIEDPYFEFKDHVRQMHIGYEHWKEEVKSIAEMLSNQPLPKNRPLWEFVLVQVGPNLTTDTAQEKGIESQPERTAIIMRINHALSDGVGILAMLLTLADNGGEVHVPGNNRTVRSPLYDSAVVATTDSDQRSAFVRELPLYIAAALRNMLTQPAGTLSYIWDLSRTQVINIVSWFLSALDIVYTPDTLGALKRAESIQLPKFYWFEYTIPVDEIKAVGRGAGGTINDVIISCVATAFREYQRRFGVEGGGSCTRLSMPINVKPLADRLKDDGIAQMGNHLSNITLKLPLDVERAVPRLRESVCRTRAIKQRPLEVMLTSKLMSVGARASTPTFHRIMEWGNNRSTAILSNIAGPTTPLQINNKKVDDIIWYIPLFNNIGISLQVMSYDGTIRIGMGTDRELIKEGNSLKALFMEAYEDLRKQMLLRNPGG